MNAVSYNTRPMPLFDKYGGIRVLRHVIMEFYDRVLDSDTIGHFFDNIDIARLIDHQTKFFSMVLGGPAQFSDERLAAAHSHLKLSHTDFDEAVALLTETLDEAGFSPEDRDSVLAAIEARRTIIVT
ncbi:MAG: group 1 truncated hemoglobin [Arenibacterium sp.]